MTKDAHLHIKKNTNQLKIVIGLFGAGGFAREVMPFLHGNIAIAKQTNCKADCQIFFVETNPKHKKANGYPLISKKDFLAIECDERFFNIAISDSRVRERIANECIASGAKPMTIQSPNSIIYDCNAIGEGAIICAYSMVTSNATIGKFFHSNLYSYVAHDCIIGDYVTFSPNVHCNGNVHIGNHVFVGTGVIIKQGLLSKPLVIGEGAVLGMGAVVIKDVAPYTTVVGNPARPHKF